MIGAGVMGNRHAAALSKLDSAELVAIVDSRFERANQADGVAYLPNIAELKNHGVAAAVVAVPTSLHETVGVQLIDMGIHLMIEKPLASNPASAERLVAAVAETNLVGAVGHVERFNPALVELRRRVDRSEFGRLLQVSTTREGPNSGRIPDVGVVMDLATHDIDIVKSLARTDYEALYAQTIVLGGLDHESSVFAVGRMSGGELFSHTVNWISPKKKREVVAIFEKASVEVDLLAGDLVINEPGTIPIEWDRLALGRGSQGGRVTRTEHPRWEPLQRELIGFLAAVSDGGTDFVSFADASRTVQIAHYMLESARIGEEIKV